MRFSKKIFLFWALPCIAALFAAFFMYGQSEAKVHGVCSNCHTMHNSQNALSMVEDPISGQSSGAGDWNTCQSCHNEPRVNLLTYNCVGCHAKDLVGDAIDSVGILDIPQVYYGDSGESLELAAGNFTHVAGFERWTYGHNVHGFWNDDIKGDIDPPGYLDAMDPAPVSQKYDDWPYGGVQQVFCAGSYGCHGSRAIESQTLATQGTHHSDDTAVKFNTFDFDVAGSTPGKSYRFLSGVKGVEDDDWEYLATQTEHNEYYGRDVGYRDTQETQDKVETMSEFCASCHGNFHKTGLNSGEGISMGSSSTPWIRHPTDLVIPTGSPYGSYNTYMKDGADDYQTVRIARLEGALKTIGATANASGSTDISGGTAVVFCLSCHKAHASRYEDSLRFSYPGMVTGSATNAGKGCFACHTDKDG